MAKSQSHARLTSLIVSLSTFSSFVFPAHKNNEDSGAKTCSRIFFYFLSKKSLNQPFFFNFLKKCVAKLKQYGDSEVKPFFGYFSSSVLIMVFYSGFSFKLGVLSRFQPCITIKLQLDKNLFPLLSVDFSGLADCGSKFSVEK